VIPGPEQFATINPIERYNVRFERRLKHMAETVQSAFNYVEGPLTGKLPSEEISKAACPLLSWRQNNERTTTTI
jgi:hypothetical protein